jgi:hypothetical protein
MAEYNKALARDWQSKRTPVVRFNSGSVQVMGEKCRQHRSSGSKRAA